MDVRQSLNVEDNLAVVSGDGQMSFIEGDSFYAKAPPLAASTVGRTKARRMMKPDSEMGSFLDETPVSAPKSSEDGNQKQLLFDSLYSGARPKSFNFQCPDGGDQPFELENGTDWSVVNDWCRENKQDTDMSDQDGKSSLGLINVDDMDLSSNNLLLDSAMGKQAKRNTSKDSTLQDLQGTGSQQSSMKEHVSMDTQYIQHEGSLSLKELGSADSNPWKHDGSSSNNSQDSKPEQLFARSQLGTVKKANKDANKKDPVVAAMRQMLFGQSAIGEENEGDESVYNVELGEDDLQELDADFDMNCSVAGESDSEKSPEKTPTNKTTSASRYGEELPLDSVYFRPGTTGEEQTHPQLPYLSKVSLFDGGSGSEIDTEDELELVRKAQGERKEAAGEDSDGQGRPGLEGLSLTDETSRQLPITQRQSAEGNVVTSPVPGDGGGGGDGSSGPDSDDDNVVSQSSSNAADQQEQRIRPMGDDLLSDLRFSRYATSSTGQAEADVGLSSRYLTPGSAMDDSVQPSFNIDEFLASRNSPLDQDFDPGNRLEASGFNADDASTVNNKANPFDVKSSSFGSFGLNGSDGQGIVGNDSMFSVEIYETGPNDELQKENEILWAELEGSIGTSQGSKASSLDHQTSLGRRSAASGSPRNDQRMLTTGSQNGSDRFSSGTQGSRLSSPRNSTQPPDNGSQPLSDNEIFRKPSVPAPKAAKFSQSQAKSKLSTSRSSASNSVQSSNGSSVKSYSSEGVDLELRTSLSGKVKEQREGLRRVPSWGGTSAMDLTVNDEDFFHCADGKAMIDADEVVFEEEHVFRQDDAMADTGPQNDSWAYRSIMTVARPSWLEDTSQEEEVCVRISVGTFMRGRTEALGSLTGDGDEPRPDFGMRVDSPPKAIVRPSRLIDEHNDTDSAFESTRTCGVGEYGYGTPVRSKSDKEEDCTLTMDSLLKSPKPEPSFSVSSLNIDDLGGKTPVGKSKVNESPLLSMGEISMIVNAADCSVSSQSKRLQTLMASKCGSKPGLSQNSAGSATPSSVYTLSSAHSRNVFQKSSQLSLNKDSNVSRSFPKVADSDKSLLNYDSKSKGLSGDMELKKSSYEEIVPDSKMVDDGENRLVDSNARKSDQSEVSDDIWSSPNTSNCLPAKLDNFKFSTNNDLVEEFRTKFKILSNTSASGQGDNTTYDDFAKKDREKTPPPDGQSGREKAKVVKDKGCTPQISRKFSDNGLKIDTNSSKLKSNTIGNQPDIIPGQGLLRKSPVHDKKLLENDNERSRLDTSAVDHGYMPGHHIPDGTEYSQRSDYAHINHKGELREDVAGMDDVGLAESRGFDILKKRISNARNIDNRFLENYESLAEFASDRNQNKLDVNLQPTQSRSPMIKPVAKLQNSVQNVDNHDAEHRNQNEINDDGHKANEDLNNADTQTDLNTRRLESWTQTSFVLNQNPENQTENILTKTPNLTLDDDNHSHCDNHVKISGIPPKIPVSSFKHNLLPNNQSAVAEKPHLLTKQSLMQTGFAQDNLRRDYSVEVMDRIYARNSVSSHGHFHTMNVTSEDMNFIPQSRESLESHREWRVMQGRETLDTIDGDFPRLSDVYGDGTSFMRLASAQSTPYPLAGSAFSHFTNQLGSRESMFSQTGVNPTPSHRHTELSTGPLSKTDVNFSRCLPEKNPVCSALCPVEAPGVLKFKEVCCVGISRKEVLPLYNPTDRWMECIIQVNALEINGRAVPLEGFPFTIRQEKIIIDPRKTESIDVMFLPKCAGAYIAHVQVFSKSFEKKQDRQRDVIPVNVTIQAISEHPRIKVYEKDCEDYESRNVVDFGGVVWGTCKEKTICIRNVGLAAVPLRLALTSNKGWHCFSFEPEGRESDVSIISGRTLPSSSSHGRGIINLTLTGSNQPFNYHEVKIWCRPPDKQCTKALCKQPPEVLGCKMDVEVDIPSCKFPKLSSINISASVGVQKLHIQSNLKELRLTCAPNKVVETHFKVFNAGNLPLDAVFGFSAHKHLFSVSPTSLTLKPGIDCELSVAFKPKEDSLSRLASLLLMYVQPDGPMFELSVQGEVKEEIKQPIKLYCDQTVINFGGVALGKTCVKKFSLMNKHAQSLNLCAMVRADNILIARSPDPRTVGCKSLDLQVPGKEDIVTVYVLYNPVTPSKAAGKIVIKQVPMDSSLKFSVQVSGYGGVSRLCCSEESTSQTRVGDIPCIGIRSFSLGKVKEMFVHNLGERPACVHVAVFKDLECKERMLSAQVVVQPSEFVIGVDVRQKLEIVVSMTEQEFAAQSDTRGVGAVLCLSYQDQVDSKRPYRSQLIVGLVKATQSDVTDFSTTATPSVSSRHRKFILTNPVEDSNDSLSHYTPRSDSSSKIPENLKPDNADGWCIKPGELTIYCSSKWPNNELDKFCIHNSSDMTKRFEIVWPGGMLSVTPAEGKMSPRENVWIKIFPTSRVSQAVDIQSWSGEVIVVSDGVRKSLAVKILRDETVPQNDYSAVPATISSPRSAALGTASNKLGNLQISRTVVQFDPTKSGKVSEETLELSNLSNQNLRWTFSSFASPYHLEKGDSSRAVSRKSYKVFEFSQQFGKLAHKGVVKLTLKFMPQSPGTYSQYWDLRTLDYEKTELNSSKQDFIRLHFTGECLENQEDRRARPALTEVENLLPRLANEVTKLRIPQDVMKFPTIPPNQEITSKTELRNSHWADVQVEVIQPNPPFYVKHTKPFIVAKKRYVRFPVEFRPLKPGYYSEILLFKSDKGDNLSLKLNGVCSLDSHR